MSVAPEHVEIWLFGQLGLGVVYLVKELWRIYTDQGHEHASAIGTLKIQQAQDRKDLDSAWERIRMLEASLKVARRNLDN